MLGRGVDLYAGKQHRQFEVLDVSRLAHDVLARKVVAALLQHLDQRRGGAGRKSTAFASMRSTGVRYFAAKAAHCL